MNTSTNKWNFVQNISVPGKNKVHLACQMNEDGSKIIIANSSYSYTNNNFSGKTQIYDFDSTQEKYIKIKKEWVGSRSNNVGQSVSINSQVTL